MSGLPSMGRLFIANQGSGDVSEIDMNSNREMTRIQVGGHLTGLAASPSGKTLFVTADQPQSQVAVVDLQNFKVIRTIPVGEAATDVTFSADGYLAFIADRGANNLTVMNAQTGDVVQTVSVGAGPVFDGYALRALVPVISATGPAPATTPSAASSAVGTMTPASSSAPSASTPSAAATTSAATTPVSSLSPTAGATEVVTPVASATSASSSTSSTPSPAASATSVSATYGSPTPTP
jgi:YVTN family beta-propeller protein